MAHSAVLNAPLDASQEVDSASDDASEAFEASVATANSSNCDPRSFSVCTSTFLRPAYLLSMRRCSLSSLERLVFGSASLPRVAKRPRHAASFALADLIERLRQLERLPPA